MERLKYIFLAALILTALNYLVACAPSSSSNSATGAMPSNIQGDWSSFRKTCYHQTADNPVRTVEIAPTLAEYFSIDSNRYELFKLNVSSEFIKIEEGSIEDLQKKYLSYSISGQYLVAESRPEGIKCQTYFKRTE